MCFFSSKCDKIFNNAEKEIKLYQENFEIKLVKINIFYAVNI